MDRTSPYRVLVVCTANMGRSANLRVYINHIAGEKGYPIEADSAGTKDITVGFFLGRGGTEVLGYAAEILREQGIDPSHRPKPLTGELVKWSDVILPAAEENKGKILERYPGAAGKTFTAREYVGESGDLMDAYAREGKETTWRGRVGGQERESPIGTNEAYRLMLAELRELAEKICEKAVGEW